MRWCCVSLVLCLLAGRSIAQTHSGKLDAQREQIAAATADAVRNLQKDVEQARISRDLTVDKFLDKLDGRADLAKTLQRAEQIGGPRWINEQTCQIQLEMNGARVAQVLVRLAAANPRKSPIAPDVLSQRLIDWDKKTFSGAGVSTASKAIVEIRPEVSAIAWSSVDDAPRREALARAKQDAAARVFESIKPVSFGAGRTIGDALAEEPARVAVIDWLENRPVTSVEFRDDLQVSVVIDAKPEDLADVLRINAARSAPVDDAGWTRLVNELQTRMAAPVGTGQVGGDATAQPRLSILPRQIPQWADRSIEAEGHAADGSSKLRTARAAEADAVDRLRAQVENLPLKDNLTIRQAVQEEPRVGQAVDRALGHARVFKTDYQNDGAVTVKMTLDLRDVWRELGN